MLALHDIETGFSKAILSGRLAKFAPHVADMELGGERRLQVYRNHFVISLTECLAATFPVLKALVGENFFDQCARAFITARPPASPVLSEYGESFPHFLFDATRSTGYAYFVDVGAFEWAINHAYHADDVTAFDPAALLSVPEERRGEMTFHFHPSCRLLSSAFPILDIWHANQADAESGAINLASGGIDLLVWRNGIDVVWRLLDTIEAAFVAALLSGASLADACAAAIAVQPSFQPNAVLADLIGGNALAGFSLTAPNTER